MQKRNLRAGHFLWFGCAVILIGVPFHAFFTAWFASNFGYFDVIRLWKEAILLVLGASCVYLVIRHPALRRDLQKSRLIQVTLAFIGFIVLMAGFGLLTGSVSWQAALYGVIIDTRSFVFLLILLVAGHLAPLPYMRRRWILIPAVIVITFGLLQMFVLPANFLRHFGYSANTLPAFQAVDNKPSLARAQSSLRGPNPLGAYLIPIIMSFVAMVVVSKKRRMVAVISIFAGLVVMYGSYSRSAMVGLAMALWLFAYWTITAFKSKRLFVGLTIGMVIIAAGLGFSLRNNDTFQNIAFHTNEKSGSVVSTNNARLSALESGIKDILHNPLGKGVGSAGPASFRNKGANARISENFFIQIGQEVGIIGLMLFVAILGAIGRILYHKRSDVLVRATLASLAGLVLVNMVSHAFADDTLAYIFFALLGYALIKTSTKSENLATLGGKKTRI
jgi:O-antigen ligase